MSDAILVTRSSRHAVLTLNRPEKRNPLPYRPGDGMRAALDELARDPAVRAVVVTGAGKAFCSGADLEALREMQGATAEQNRADSAAVRAFFEYLRSYPKPLVGAINGPAVAGGVGLALLCDVAIGCEHTRFCLSEVRIGFVPALVSEYLVHALGERAAREMMLAARWVNAEEARHLHLLHELVPSEGLLARASERAEAFAELSPEAIRRTKHLLFETAGLPLHQALERAEIANAEARQTPDCYEGIRAFLEKRSPRWSV
ncbi:MAG: enoyl-CoA hydratase [Planctomycetota bacterium]